MERYHRLYDELVTSNIRFIGFCSETNRYDYAIVYTNHFFGKPLIVCIQKGISTLMCAEDAQHTENIQRAFSLEMQEAEQLSEFFQHYLPYLQLESEY